MGAIVQWRFLIHLWTLAGLSFAMLAAQRLLDGDIDGAVRFCLMVLVVDHTDGTLARRFRVRDRIPRVSGETLDLVTDVIGLTFVPLLVCREGGVFLPGWGSAIAVLGAATCSYKYSMKARVLEDGYSSGAPPVFLSLLIFWLLRIPPAWGTAYAILLIALCWSPIRYPITSLVTTHWKPGFESITNYLAFASMIPAMIWLRAAPAICFWPILAAVLFHILVSPILMAGGIVRPGFRRAW